MTLFGVFSRAACTACLRFMAREERGRGREKVSSLLAGKEEEREECACVCVLACSVRWEAGLRIAQHCKCRRKSPRFCSDIRV